MPEVWHIRTLQNQNLRSHINNMHSSSSITTFYITFQKISHENCGIYGHLLTIDHI